MQSSKTSTFQTKIEPAVAPECELYEAYLSAKTPLRSARQAIVVARETLYYSSIGADLWGNEAARPNQRQLLQLCEGVASAIESCLIQLSTSAPIQGVAIWTKSALLVLNSRSQARIGNNTWEEEDSRLHWRLSELALVKLCKEHHVSFGSRGALKHALELAISRGIKILNPAYKSKLAFRGSPGCSIQEVAAILLSQDAAPRTCLLYTSPSPRDKRQSRMPSSA